jgi:hypothetical protein
MISPSLMSSGGDGWVVALGVLIVSWFGPPCSVFPQAAVELVKGGSCYEKC